MLQQFVCEIDQQSFVKDGLSANRAYRVCGVIPTAFIPGITGRMYQQFAVTIAISVLISAFNALSLSPALASLLLKSKNKEQKPGLLGRGGVLLSVPVAILGGYLALYMRRFQNDIFATIGVILLLGLSAKNAILIVEFAKANYQAGVGSNAFSTLFDLSNKTIYGYGTLTQPPLRRR